MNFHFIPIQNNNQIESPEVGCNQRLVLNVAYLNDISIQLYEINLSSDCCRLACPYLLEYSVLSTVLFIQVTRIVITVTVFVFIIVKLQQKKIGEKIV